MTSRNPHRRFPTVLLHLAIAVSFGAAALPGAATARGDAPGYALTGAGGAFASFAVTREAARAGSGEGTSYTLGVPGSPAARMTTDAGGNEWLSENPCMSTMAIGAPTGGLSKVSNTHLPRMRLGSAEGGFAFERSKPDLYFGDKLTPPEGVDWPATYAAYLAAGGDGRGQFLFDPNANEVYATLGGQTRFEWVLQDGRTREMTYNVSPAASGRPRRIYWTDFPYNAPAVNLSGKFVRFFGPSSLLDPEYGTITNVAAGVTQVISNKVVRGLWQDPSTHLLYAFGEMQGQVVMAYYETGTFEKILHVQVVEVCRPAVNRMAGEIGRALKPDGRGHATAGLRAQPSAVEVSDNRGDYYYQHQGEQSYSPKHGNVYPLRPTVDCPWNMEVYWMETDEMLVDWPFELDQYACDWPEDATVFVRGDAKGDGGRAVYVPSDYTATLMKYQDPEGHARAVETDGTFVTVGAGLSLLKLTADDNVWFVPVRSVQRGDTNYFTLESVDKRVGSELTLRGGTVAGVAEGFNPACDPSSPGYVYAAASDPVWNPNLYKEPGPDNDAASTTNLLENAAEAGTDTNEYASVVYGVRPGTLEVWWNTVVREADMPAPLEIPTLPQVYSLRWPADGETPQIVLASQLGSASESAFSHNAAIVLAEPDSSAALPERTYFDAENGGTVMFWAKGGGVGEFAGATLTLCGHGRAGDGDAAVNGIAIASSADWASFAERVNAGETTLDATLTADVALFQDAPFVGDTQERAYRGTFDGAGHTLTVNWKFADGTQWVAPFRFTKAATIRNLHVDGSIESDGKCAGGFVGQILSPGSNAVTSITGCRSSVTIVSTVEGDATAGGFAGHVADSTSARVEFRDCHFDGSLLGSTATSCGGFLGYKPYSAYANYVNCLFAPVGVTVSEENSYTFSRNGYDTMEQCYYTRTFGREQGRDASGMEAEELAAALGANWVASGGKAVLAGFGAHKGENILRVDLPGVAEGGSVSVVHASGSLSAPLPADGGWHHVALSFAPDALSLYVDGAPAATDSSRSWGAFLGGPADAFLGGAEVDGTAVPARAGVSLGEILFWNKALSAEEIADEMLKAHAGDENHLTGCFSFREGEDLKVGGTRERTFTDKTLGTVCTASGCLGDENGPPAIGTGVIDADGGTMPKVYAQNDPDAVGYNPNEEHAVVLSGSGGHVAWALRCDLNTKVSSAPGVLVEYVKGGRKAMQWFGVVPTNGVYPELAADCVAGKAFPGPHPIDMFDDPWCPEDTWDEPVATAPAFRDRKGQLWARAAGTATMRMYYKMQDGFAFPSLPKSQWPEIGASVPWLSLLGGDPTSSAALSTRPHPWTWRVAWPETVPEMAIGRTLTTASSGLPEVWNAKSAAVVWPPTDAERDATAVLFDPTVAQCSGFPTSTYATVSAAVAALGIKQGAGGNATLRKGRWTFDGLPPNVSSRFYLDTTADVGSCLKLEGQMEDNPGAVSLLHVNVLNEAEREAIATVLDDVASASAKAAWKAAVAKLATAPVLPSPHSAVSAGEDRVDYAPRDHYALFSMGGTGYVTIIENDSTNELMNVAEGDPISMHLIKVAPKYHTARAVTREDPLNLLSQQLSVIYAEAFAGKPESYVFEWRKCRPHPDGSVPTDFDGEYQRKFEPTAGLTRFVVGGQGDTLDNMVNTYYAVRYRAADSNSPAWAAMGDQWSGWTDPPVLAEGWVQRVLNNVTPFAQRMRDFAENPAETAISMLRQAGAPYEGDVALNQDNLAEVGLVQLYETLLSKAESMSLALGIDDGDANKQLQLAAARLADLYAVLGDEAYTDALNPTIGFGGSFNTDSTWYSLEYGTLSSALFCFDNQVPTLLDEELALLRGRTGENAPSTRVSPYYNRLVWNVTKSPAGGEVAYMVNYDVSDEGDGDGLVDAKDAARLFPQGHGDAYGHYLSALSGYYRLLRNPHFTWGTPAMGEMVVADSVVNVDYYDESKFAKAAHDVAKTAAAVVDRTARKAWRDNNGIPSAGYLDEDSGRAFGWGEWASRGGFGALANWAVGNALLPAEPDPGDYWHLAINGPDGGLLALPDADADKLPGAELPADEPWTVEFRVLLDPGATTGGTLFSALGERGAFSLALRAGDSLVAVGLGSKAVTVTNKFYRFTYAGENAGEGADKDWPTLVHEGRNGTLVCAFDTQGAIPAAWPDGYDPDSELAAAAHSGGYPAAPQWDGWVCTKARDEENGAYIPYVYETTSPGYEADLEGEQPETAVGTVPRGQDVLVAVRSDGAEGENPLVTLFDATGAKIAEKRLDFAVAFDPAFVMMGSFAGEFGEFRVWHGAARTDAELLDKRECVSPLSDGLSVYLRTIAAAPGASQLVAEVSGIVWHLYSHRWIEAEESGMEISFEDDGLNRIDRSTVPELSSLAALIPDIQYKVDRLDAGLNPLGLAEGALAFDLTPINAGDGGKTHYEQLRERAGVALENARRSLEKAQEYGSRLRLLREAESGWEASTAASELETKNKLIEYFGYPYEGDIGPAGTYPQGYDGPDVYNYAWMEPELYGLNSVADTVSVEVVKKTKPALFNVFVPFWPSSSTEATTTWSFERSATGFILKPSGVTGKRRAQGKIQDAIADFLVAYAHLKSKMDTAENKLADFEGAVTSASLTSVVTELKNTFAAVSAIKSYITAGQKAALNASINSLQLMGALSEQAAERLSDAIPQISGAGLTVNIDPRALADAVLGPAYTSQETIRASALLAAKNSIAVIDAGQSWTTIAKGLLTAMGEIASERVATYTKLRDRWYDVRTANSAMLDAYRELQAAQATVETVVAEAERVIDERTLARKQAANILTKARYNEMFFRLARNNALSRYDAQFALAQKYAWLAAKAYDYETGLLSTDRAGGDAFLARIVGTRTIGEFDADGNPTVASDAAKGDGGLAAVLAEMDGNWLVLKSRLGINNPQPYATWFSLRHDFFRILDGADGDKTWRTTLRDCVVDDLNKLPEFVHYCQPLAGSTADREPGLVIPFPSVIAAGLNFFGNDLAGGDAALDPTWYATHVSAAGVHFVGYDPSGLSRTPSAYLVPAGEDRMRAVGDPDTVISWKVVDQTIPAPYAIGSAQLDDPDWTPLYDGTTGGNDLGARIRKHPSFRAYYAPEGEDPSDSSLDCTRLVGRSAWNTRWLLVIPASSLAADREAALSAFIDGLDTDRDGTPDSPGVSDIRIGLKTYSTSGN